MSERKCQREGCENPIPDGRRKYCCNECGIIANRASERARQKEEAQEVARAKAEREDRKVRVCLRCGKSFQSSWPGNRRCSTCERAVEAGVSGWPVRAHVPSEELAACLDGWGE